MYPAEVFDTRIQKFLGINYDYHADPNIVLAQQSKNEQSYSSNPIELESINCVTLAHLLTFNFTGVRLPIYYDSVHMILDQTYLRDLTSKETPIAGDLLFVGQAGIKEFRTIPEEIKINPEELGNFKKEFPAPHVAVFTGKFDNGNPLYVHATWVEQQVVIWPEIKFDNYPRYRQIYARRRVKEL